MVLVAQTVWTVLGAVLLGGSVWLFVKSWHCCTPVSRWVLMVSWCSYSVSAAWWNLLDESAQPVAEVISSASALVGTLALFHTARQVTRARYRRAVDRLIEEIFA